MKLSIITPDKIVISDQQITGLFAETTDGPLGILDHHASLLTNVNAGSLRVVAGGSTENYILRSATIDIDNTTNTAKILALSCEEVSELDQLDLTNYLKYLEESLADPGLSPGSLKYKFLQGEKIALERQKTKK